MIAVKEIRLDEDDSVRFRGDFKWVQEVYILRELEHRYVVKYEIVIFILFVEMMHSKFLDSMVFQFKIPVW
jgi:hypothetical protein